MIKEILRFSKIDPDVLEARNVAKKLQKALGMCQDPSTKKAFKGMVFDALDYEVELKVKSQAEQVVGMLHDLKAPKTSKN